MFRCTSTAGVDLQAKSASKLLQWVAPTTYSCVVRKTNQKNWCVFLFIMWNGLAAHASLCPNPFAWPSTRRGRIFIRVIAKIDKPARLLEDGFFICRRLKALAKENILAMVVIQPTRWRKRLLRIRKWLLSRPYCKPSKQKKNRVVVWAALAVMLARISGIGSEFAKENGALTSR